MATLFFLIIFSLIVNGCTEQPVQPLKTQSTSTKQSSKEAKQPIPATDQTAMDSESGESTTLYSYRSDGRRDPFKSLLLGLKEKKSAGLTPLQQRSLGELRVIGIIWGADGRVAMIETPDGKGYLIKEGALVGPDGGIVQKIIEDSVIIEEIFTDYYGRKKTKKTVLGLRPKEEGGG